MGEPKTPRLQSSEEKKLDHDAPLPAWLFEDSPVPVPKPEVPRIKRFLNEAKTWLPLIAIGVTLGLFVLTYPFTKGGNEAQVRSANLTAASLVPHLEAKLVVDEVLDGAFSFHFELRNIGKQRAKNIGYLYSMPDGLMLGDDADAKHPRDLAPDTAMSLRPETRNQPVPSGEPTRRYLILTYSADHDGAITWFRRRVQFTLYSPIRVGPLLMDEGADSNEKPGLNKEIVSLGVMTTLDGPQGSASVAFDLEDQHKTEVSVFLSATNQALFYEPLRREMFFQIQMSASAQVLQLHCPLSAAEQRHHVSIAWDPLGARLSCDGNEVHGSRLQAP